MPEINGTIFKRIRFILDQYKKHTPQTPSPSHGVVLLGEAGAGKTHLLMRVAQQLSKGHFVLFVPMPNHEEAVYLHTWSNIVQSLAKVVPARSPDRSQLDDLLAHVFSAVLIPDFEKSGDQERRWAKRLRANPLDLFGMLGEGHQRERNFRSIRERTLRQLRQTHPTIDVGITRALITYVLAANDRTRQSVLTWLAGQGGINETQSKSLGLPMQWVEVDEQSNHLTLLQQRENQAFAAIKTLGMLSTYYQPLILAYNQLEGMRTRENLTRRWSEAARDIITFAPNYLVLTCVFPSIWEAWTRAAWIETSSSDRLGGSAHTFALELFAFKHALGLLERETAAKARELDLPSLIYPFDEAEVAAICKQVKTPRSFKAEVHKRFVDWLFQDDEVPPPAPEVDKVLAEELSRLEKTARASIGRLVPNEEDLFGKVRYVVEELLKDFAPRFRKAELGSRVMPFNIVVLPPSSPGLCLTILNSSGNPLTARLRNLNEVSRKRDAFGKAIILRDRRCGEPRSGTVGQEILRTLQREGNVYLEADTAELARLHAIYDAILAVAEEALQAGGKPITLGDLVGYLRHSGYLRSCALFVKAAEHSPLFEDLVNGDK